MIQSKKKKSILGCVCLVISILLIGVIYIFRKQVFGLIILAIAALMYTPVEPTVITDLEMYQHVIGEQVDREYSNKPSEYEFIFPDTLDGLNVEEFQMVHYTSSDEQYLAYLTVTYDEEEYEKELERLGQLGIADYIGEYGSTGFSEYDLQALFVLYQHRGMVYALEDNENKTISYVELIFGNYFYGFDYEEYIDKNLLPDNFDATENNVYQETYVEEMNETQDR